ncbi:MAG: hypothetical protein WBG32_17695 [Nodosilinea sp.]
MKVSRLMVLPLLLGLATTIVACDAGEPEVGEPLEEEMEEVPMEGEAMEEEPVEVEGSE